MLPDRPHRLARISALSALACSSLLGAVTAHADFFTHHWDLRREAAEQLRFGIGLPSYRTKENYAKEGATFRPPGFERLYRWGTDLDLDYGLTDRLTVFGSLRWTWERVKGDLRGGTAYGFSDQTAGATFRLLEGRTSTSDPAQGPRPEPWAVDIQSQVDFAVYNNQSADQDRTPYLGDGTLDMSFGGFGTFPLSDSLTFLPGIGFTFRNAGFSSAVPWSATARWTPEPTGIFFRAGLTGLQSLVNDEDTAIQNARAPDDTTRSAGSGGSYFANAINPSLVSARGTLGYATASHWTLSATLDQSIWGHSAPRGTAVILGIELRDDRSDKARHESKFARPEVSPDGANETPPIYNLDARVITVNDGMNLIKIDHGSDDGIAPGQSFDFFSINADGSTHERVARARVISVTENETALEVTEYFQQVWIDEGFSARRIGTK